MLSRDHFYYHYDHLSVICNTSHCVFLQFARHRDWTQLNSISIYVRLELFRDVSLMFSDKYPSGMQGKCPSGACKVHEIYHSGVCKIYHVLVVRLMLLIIIPLSLWCDRVEPLFDPDMAFSRVLIRYGSSIYVDISTCSRYLGYG